MDLLFFLAMAVATPDSAITIPLADVWGYGIPGTRDIRELEPKADGAFTVEELTRRLDVWKIKRVLQERPTEGEKAGPGFIVLGSGKQALKNAWAGFADSRNRLPACPADTELTLVWYSHMCGAHVRLVNIGASNRTITVKYRFVTHPRDSMSTSFALIPLGKLAEGTYKVNVEELPAIDILGKPSASLRDPKRIVCNSFSFEVQRE